MLFMVIERFRNRDAAPVYRRFRQHGRMLPDGLRYRASWIETNFDRCFQLMECDDERLFAEWIAKWSDLADFEVVPITTSDEVQSNFFSQA
jgi:Protein of unknown function (DUF3303)